MSASIQALLTAYKRNVAGAYRSLAPDRIEAELPPGPCNVSEKIDGETWFLHADGVYCVLLSPFGKMLEDISLTNEAQRILHGWRGLLAGELYADVESGRPHVFDLHAALGKGANALSERLRFATFDVLMDGDKDVQRSPFAERLTCLQRIVGSPGERFHLAPMETMENPAGVAAGYERIVTQGGAEGIVIHAADSRIYKIKPEISIDAAVVAYAVGDSGVSELLLALLKPDGVFQLIGRVKTGWSREENTELLKRLTQLSCESSYRKVNDHGLLYRWVKPQLVVEVKCNDLIAANSRDEFIRRMALRYEEETGWSPVSPAPAVSMINAVFRHIREDKRAVRPDVRFEQVSDFAPIAEQAAVDPASLPASEILRREVYRKATPHGLAVRKLVGWRTNKSEVDPACPAYVVFFTDYAPRRQQPLKTDLRVASSDATMHAFADDWLAANIKRGWEQAVSDESRMTNEDNLASAKAVSPSIRHSEFAIRHLKISFARSSSPTFPIIRRRLDALTKLGSLNIAKDDKDREAWFELTISRGLVENARRIDNLFQIVRAWKTTEVSLDGELLSKHDLQDFINRIEDARRCWLKHKMRGPEGCRSGCTLGCDALRIRSSHQFLSYAGNDGPSWWTVGAFDGEALRIDKDALKQRIASPLNDGVRLCPHFDREALLAKIDALPEVLRTGGNGWITLYNNDGKPVWLWPADQKIPPSLRTTKDNPWRSGGLNIRVGFEGEEERGGDRVPESPSAKPSTPARAIPPTRYADILGQDEAVQAVRDLIELPLKHADLFARIGAIPKAGGVILAGPPGTGKTLLARAVAGECGAHIEFVSGPELLSKWVGETEASLRSIFEWAKALAPSVILFDEIDCLAVTRGSAEAQYQRSMVTQFLALMDGLEERGKVFVIATTNRPDDIDPALGRPGRFDQIVHMGLPDEAGRAAIFRHYLEPLVLAPALDSERLASDLAALTTGLTGADIAHVCQHAALLCVKDASRTEPPPEDLAITRDHFRRAVEEVLPANPASRMLSTSRDPEPFNGNDSPQPPSYLMRG